MKQHKWHKEIKAWADGAEIEIESADGLRWNLIPKPDWNFEYGQYRIKPHPKQQKYLYAILCANGEVRIIKPAAFFSGTVIGKIEVQDD